MYKIAIKMLMGNTAKYYLLIAAITFSTLLMAQQSAIFCGFMRMTTSTLRNVSATLWVVDPSVEQVGMIKPMRDIDLARVKSVPGIRWASPYYQQTPEIPVGNGGFTPIYLIGVDESTLAGLPKNVLSGNVKDIWQAHAVIIDLQAIEKLSKDPKNPLRVGSIFELNDKEARVVAIIKPELSVSTYPTIITTYHRALEYAPKLRKNLGYILVEAAPGIDLKELAARIQKETGLKVYNQEDFFWSTVRWYFKNTAIPLSFMITITLGFIVGFAVTGQTFYMFINENLPKFCALKAMGADNKVISKMLLLQASLVGFIGFGCGVGISSLFALSVLKKGIPPYYLPNEILLGIGVLVIVICIFAAYLGMRKIRTVEAAQVFHG
jgi:putative ABC transport system permease protein